MNICHDILQSSHISVYKILTDHFKVILYLERSTDIYILHDHVKFLVIVVRFVVMMNLKCFLIGFL